MQPVALEVVSQNHRATFTHDDLGPENITVTTGSVVTISGCEIGSWPPKH